MPPLKLQKPVQHLVYLLGIASTATPYLPRPVVRTHERRGGAGLGEECSRESGRTNEGAGRGWGRCLLNSVEPLNFVTPHRAHRCPPHLAKVGTQSTPFGQPRAFSPHPTPNPHLLRPTPWRARRRRCRRPQRSRARPLFDSAAAPAHRTYAAPLIWRRTPRGGPRSGP